jgi:hypothetical protein
MKIIYFLCQQSPCRSLYAREILSGRYQPGRIVNILIITEKQSFVSMAGKHMHPAIKGNIILSVYALEFDGANDNTVG